MKYQVIQFCQTMGGDTAKQVLCELNETGYREYRQDFELFGYSELHFESLDAAKAAICEYNKINASDAVMELRIDNKFPVPLPYITCKVKHEGEMYSIGLIYPTKFGGFYV